MGIFSLCHPPMIFERERERSKKKSEDRGKEKNTCVEEKKTGKKKCGSKTK